MKKQRRVKRSRKQRIIKSIIQWIIGQILLNGCIWAFVYFAIVNSTTLN